MLGKGRMALLPVALVGLACGGMGADAVRTEIEATCGAAGLQPPSVELVFLDGVDLPAPKLAVQLDIDDARWLLDGRQMDPDPAALREQLAEKAAVAKELAARTGSADFAFRGELLLLLPPSTPGRAILPILETAYSAGFPNVRLVVRTGQSPPRSYVDAAYGAELTAHLDGRSPEERAMLLAEELQGLLVACPPGQQVIDAVAYASAESKCPMMAVGLAEALPMCPLTDHGKVVTAVQVANDGSRWSHGVLALTLDPDGPAWPVAPEAPWSELAPRWAKEGSDAGTWWVLEGTDAD